MSPFDPNKHHRRSIRLTGYDYTQAGAYFITLVVSDRECLLGEIVGGEIQINDYGRIVEAEWSRLPTRFQILEIGPAVIMPNHFHAIFRLRDSSVSDDNHRERRFGTMIPDSVPSIVRSFKSSITLRINSMMKSPGQVFWQRNYYERIIRDPDEYDRISHYVENNPFHWEIDQLNPGS